MRWHVVDASTIPRDDEGTNDMLYQAWEAIDAWIVDHRDDVADARA